jgi:superoxide reductase
MPVSAKLQVFRCNKCGNMVEVVRVGGGTLVCCGQQMEQLNENVTDAAKEKHVPVFEKTPDGVKVRIGSVPHPMEAKHWIEWIEVIAGGKAYRQYLNPGEKPEAFFPIKDEPISAREYCNLHGLWKV